MKRILLSLFLLVAFTWQAAAAVTFDPDTKYSFRCAVYGAGSLMTGAKHQSSAYLYYSPTMTGEADSWWYIRKDGNGYHILNADGGEYIVYNPERIENVAKGLVLSTGPNGDAGRWNLTASGDFWTVRSVEQPDQWWNLRTDGSGLLGTYAGTGSQNELFTIIDEKGQEIRPDGTVDPVDPIEPSKPENFFLDTKGITAEGEYWERTGLDEPVVYTTDTTNPVLYSIANLRRSHYLYDDGTKLTQTDAAGRRSQFYFVKKGAGVQLFTSEGRYVTTSYPQYYERTTYVDTKSGTTEGDIWALSPRDEYFSGAGVATAYLIEKKDNLPGTGYGEENGQSAFLFLNDYNGQGVGMYDADPGSLFVFASSDKRHLDYLKKKGISFEDGPTPPPVGDFGQYVDSVRLGNKQLIYDRASRGFYASIPAHLQDGGTLSTTLTVKAKAAYSGYTVRLDGTTPEGDEGALTIEGPSCQKAYTLTLHNGEGVSVASAPLRMTFMPIVEVNVPYCNSSEFTPGTFCVTDGSTTVRDTLMTAAFRYRGATSLSKEKKSWAVKLRDKDGKSVDGAFFGLREDNNWILDAMAVDPACMRNRLATDLWNDFSTPPYYKDREKKAINGTRGRFVEVFYNGSYHGIYCMTEKLDRKQLKLKKYQPASETADGRENIRGLLYKASEWSYETFFGHYQGSEDLPGHAPSGYKNYLGAETWANFEIKYPDFEEEAVEWAPLWSAINFTATSNDATFEKELKTRIDYPVLKDYYLFIELLLATDNHGKNMFYYVYDRTGAEGDRLGIGPWDMDGVWGARWDGSTHMTTPEQDFDSFIRYNEHGTHTLFIRLRRAKTIDWAGELAERYAELRQKYFNTDYLSEAVDRYKDLFVASSADEREQRRWGQYHPQLVKSADYLKTWMESRIAFLDEKYGFDPTTVGINEAVAERFFHAEGGNGCIAVSCGSPCRVSVYNLSGRLVKTATVEAGCRTIGGLAPGLYLVNGRKVIVR